MVLGGVVEIVGQCCCNNSCCSWFVMLKNIENILLLLVGIVGNSFW